MTPATMVRPRGALVVPKEGMIVPRACSMVTHFHADHYREVLRVRRMLEEARDAEVNAVAPVTIGTREWA